MKKKKRKGRKKIEILAETGEKLKFPTTTQY